MDIRLTKPFAYSVKEIIGQMAEMEIHFDEEGREEGNDVFSLGIASIMTFAGKRKGRLLLDMEPALALEMARSITGSDYGQVTDPMVLATISELNNIIGGNAITRLNNEFSWGMRLAPPIVFTGEDFVVSIPKIPSVSFSGSAGGRKIRLNIAFEGGL